MFKFNISMQKYGWKYREQQECWGGKKPDRNWNSMEKQEVGKVVRTKTMKPNDEPISIKIPKNHLIKHEKH